MDVVQYNRTAWDREAEKGNRWTLPVTPEQVAEARNGPLKVVLTPQKLVPETWLGPIEGRDVLGLACGGGQQMPLFAAAGARVTVIDNSPAQIARDAEVAEREGLEITTALGDMGDLSRFPDASFDLIFHPVSNCFRPSIHEVWREAHRVLRPGGRLLSGFCKPVLFLLDPEAEKEGRAELKFSLPYSDLDVSEADRIRWFGDAPLCFAHSLEAQIGGQIAAGLVLKDLFEDAATGDDVMAKHMPAFMATWSQKPG